MAEVRATLQLESSDALSTVDSLGTALDTVVTNFSTSFTAELAALQAPIADLAATPLVEQVSADTSEAQNAIGALDATPVEVPVEADTTDAENSINALGDSAGGASEKVSSLGDSTKFLEGAAAAGAGEVGGLRSAAEGLGVSSIAGYAGVVALAGGVAGLAQEGIKAASAQQRFNLIVGQSADAFKNIRVGDLNISLEELSSKLGATTAEMQNAIATVYLHGQAAGFSTQKTIQYSQELVALGARAVATNPAIGNLGDVISGLDVKFARSRGLVQYGIALSQGDINQRALTDSGKTSATQLTVQDKAFAGLNLAVEKYGTGLSDKIAKGAENAALQQRALTAEIKNAVEEIGKPLVAPFLEVLRSGVPVIKDLASGLAVLGPVLGIVATLAPELEALAVGFIALKVVGALATTLEVGATAFYVLRAAMIGTEAAAEASAAGIVAANTTIEASSGPIGLLIAGLSIAAVSFGLFSGGAKEATLDIDALGKKTDEALHKMATAQLANLIDLFGKTKGAAAATAVALGDVSKAGETNIGVATRLAQAYLDVGIISETQYAEAVKKAIAADNARTASAQQTASAVTTLSEADQKALFQSDATAEATKRLDTAHKNAISTYSALVGAGHAQSDALRQEAIGYANAQQAATDYKASLDILNTGHLSLAQAETQTFSQEIQLKKALDDSKGSLDLTTEAGNKAETALEQRVAGEQAYATALTASTGSTDAATQHMGAFRQSLIDTLNQMHVAPEAIEPLLQKLGVDLPDAASQGAAQTDAALTGPDGISASTKKAIDQTKALFNVDPLSSEAYLFGYGTGQHFEAGITNALTNASLPDSMAPQAAKALVRAIKFALDNAGSPSEHLFYDSGIAHAGAYGAGFQTAGQDVVDAATAITRAAAATTVPVGAGVGASGGGAGGSGPSQTNNFYGYSPQETAAVNGREWTRLTRFSGVG